MRGLLELEKARTGAGWVPTRKGQVGASWAVMAQGQLQLRAVLLTRKQKQEAGVGHDISESQRGSGRQYETVSSGY